MKLRIKLGNAGFQDWNVNAKCRRTVRPIANVFGLSVEEFLRQHTLGELPGQPKRKMRSALFRQPPPRPPVGFGVNLGNRSSVKDRLDRTARFTQKTPEALVWEAILGMIECHEEDMILDPVSGEPIADELILSSFQGSSELRS